MDAEGDATAAGCCSSGRATKRPSDVLADDVVAHWPDREVAGREQLVALIIESTRAMFDELSFELEVGRSSTGDLVAARWSGARPRGGRRGVRLPRARRPAPARRPHRRVLGRVVDRPALTRRLRGLRHDDLRRDVGARRAHRRDQPRPGLPGHRRAARGARGRGRRRCAAATTSTRPARASRRCARRSPRTSGASTGSSSTPTARCWSPPAPPRRSRRRCSRSASRATRWSRSSRTTTPTPPASPWRAPRRRVVTLRPPGLRARPRRARRRVHAAHPARPAQHAAQPDRQGLHARRAGADRRALPRARRARGHRRGLRAPGLRRPRARPAGDAAGHGRAHADDLLGRQDVLVHGLEDRLGVPARASSSPRCGPPSSSSPSSAARRSSPRSPSRSACRTRTSRASAPTCRPSATGCATGCEAAGFDVFRPAGTYFVTADIRPLGVDDGRAFCLALPERAASWRCRPSSSTTTRRPGGRSCASRSASATR